LAARSRQPLPFGCTQPPAAALAQGAQLQGAQQGQGAFKELAEILQVLLQNVRSPSSAHVP